MISISTLLDFYVLFYFRLFSNYKSRLGILIYFLWSLVRTVRDRKKFVIYFLTVYSRTIRCTQCPSLYAAEKKEKKRLPNSWHGSTRAPGHAFLAWRSSWRMVVYIYYIRAAGNSQLGSSWLGNRCGRETSGPMARRSHTKAHMPGHSPPASQAGRRVGPAL